MDLLNRRRGVAPNIWVPAFVDVDIEQLRIVHLAAADHRVTRRHWHLTPGERLAQDSFRVTMTENAEPCVGYIAASIWVADERLRHLDKAPVRRSNEGVCQVGVHQLARV